MIEFRNVSKTYDTGTEAVHKANFTIEKGEFAFLVGTSGSGVTVGCGFSVGFGLSGFSVGFGVIIGV